MGSHIAFFNFPAVGHVHPTLGVVEELVRRGHRVTCVATGHFGPAIEAAGGVPVHYRSVFGEYYTSPFTQEAMAGEGLRCLDEALSAMEQVEDFYAGDPPDVLLHDFMAWGARFLAARRNLPAIRLFPTYGANEHFSIQAKFPMAEMTDAKLVEMVGRLEELLPRMGMPGMSAMEFFMHPERLAIIFLSREFHYDGDTFDDRFVFAGPCLGDRSGFQGSWQPPGGDRPVLLVSLGSAATGWPEFFPMCLEAFGHSGWHVVLAVGDHLDPADLGRVPANVEVHRQVPQLDVLEHARLFVTHGGMNSTMESLYHGVPMVVIPQMNEQRANALRVDELGLGRYLPRADAAVASLRSTVVEVSADTGIRDRVEETRHALRKINGPAVAADAIEKFLAGSHGARG